MFEIVYLPPPPLSLISVYSWIGNFDAAIANRTSEWLVAILQRDCKFTAIRNSARNIQFRSMEKSALYCPIGIIWVFVRKMLLFQK